MKRQHKRDQMRKHVTSQTGAENPFAVKISPQLRDQATDQALDLNEAALAASLEFAAFRKLDAAAQLQQLRGQKVERTFQVDRENGIDKEARTVWLSIASEEPYERWWGVEVLDMGKQSIRDARLKLGAPLLVGHDTADQVGVVEDYEISAGRKLRVLARFGRSARAEEIWQDVLDGIRRNTSVGYIIHDLVLEKSEDGVNTYRVTDWEPLEGSLVPVPADPTVGLGRAAANSAAPPTIQTRSPAMDEKEKAALVAKIEAETRARVEGDMKAAAELAAKQAAEKAAGEKRVKDLLAAGDEYKADGGPEVARELINDPNATVETFKARLFEKMRGKQRPLPQDGDPQGGREREAHYGAGARQIIRHGVLRAFTKPISFTDGTRMEPVEAAYRSGQWLLATVGQNERAQRWCRDQGLYTENRVMTTESGSVGGYLVPDEMEQSIIDLRVQYGLARKLARRRPMASDTKSVPKRTGGVTAYFVGEDNSGVTASDKSWGNVNLVAKTLAALSLISKNLEEDSIIDVVDDLAQEQAYAFATKEDQCWLIGDGTSTYAGMQGLITLMEATAFASRPDAATNHDTFAEYDNADITAVMGVVADFPGIQPVWLCSKLFANVTLNRLKATAGGNSVMTLEGRPREQYLGYDIYTSDIMPKVLTDLSDKVNAFFGDFSMSSSFGDRRGIMIEVLRERYAEKLQVGILGHERFHVVNHDLGSTSVFGPVGALYGD